MLHSRQSNVSAKTLKILIPEKYLIDFEGNNVENRPMNG
jgi:hypothetical protein